MATLQHAAVKESFGDIDRAPIADDNGIVMVFSTGGGARYRLWERIDHALNLSPNLGVDNRLLA